MGFRKADPAVVAERHRRYLAKVMPPPEAMPRPRNVQPVLDFGDTVYRTFRGRAYGVPPLPWRAGQTMLTLWLDIREQAQRDEHQRKPLLERHYAIVRQIPPLIWRHCRPVGRWRRLLYRLHLLRNPFEQATEAELVEWLGFTLQRRMRSSIGSPSPALHPSPRTS